MFTRIIARLRRPDECELTRARLSEYLDGALGPAERTRIESHLATCEECRTELAELRETVHLLQRLPERPIPRSFALPRPAVAPSWSAAPGFWPSSALLARATASLGALFAIVLAGSVALQPIPSLGSAPTIAPAARTAYQTSSDVQSVTPAAEAAVAQPRDVSPQASAAPPLATPTDRVVSAVAEARATSTVLTAPAAAAKPVVAAAAPTSAAAAAAPTSTVNQAAPVSAGGVDQQKAAAVATGTPQPSPSPTAAPTAAATVAPSTPAPVTSTTSTSAPTVGETRDSGGSDSAVEAAPDRTALPADPNSSFGKSLLLALGGLTAGLAVLTGATWLRERRTRRSGGNW